MRFAGKAARQYQSGLQGSHGLLWMVKSNVGKVLRPSFSQNEMLPVMLLQFPILECSEFPLVLPCVLLRIQGRHGRQSLGHLQNIDTGDDRALEY